MAGKSERLDQMDLEDLLRTVVMLAASSGLTCGPAMTFEAISQKPLIEEALEEVRRRIRS
jgi:hypothetical protein